MMLSPKARNFVALSLGGATTAMRKLQEAACCAASRAVHATLVDPTSKGEPLCRVHVVVTGGVPPVATGAEDLARFHGVDERLGVAAYGDAIRFYRRFVRAAAF